MAIPLTMMEKRDDFAGWLEDLLQVHDASFTADTLERKEIEQPVDRKTRLSVTGDPERYCIVRDIGRGSLEPANLSSTGSASDYQGHTFDVRIFWKKAYATTYAASSQSDFEAMVYNESDAASPGVLATIRETGTRLVSGVPYKIGRYGADPIEGLVRGTWDFGAIGEPELCHYLNFQITLI